MSNDAVIKVENVSKKFTTSLKRSMAYGSLDMARNFLGLPTDQSILRKSEFWALKDLNFELRKGEALGIVGINGSGKSTLLRLLTGIYPPDTGKITIDGTIGSLIAVGAGFHPHMTGRENVYLNGVILGMTKDEIAAKFDEIINFAEIGSFLDAPVSTYSSGMRVRLGFAIAIHCNPDILLIDEILSVGDLSFRNKSLRYMAEYRDRAKALIFVSHNLEQVLLLCDRVIILDRGQIIYDGETEAGISKYYDLTNELKLNSNIKEIGVNINKGKFKASGDVSILKSGLIDSKGEETNIISQGDDLNLFYDIEVHKLIDNPVFSSVVRNDDNSDLIWYTNLDKKTEFKNLQPGKYRLLVKIEKPPFVPNAYFMGISVKDGNSDELFLQIQNLNSFKITGQNGVPRGVIACNNEWSLLPITQ